MLTDGDALGVYEFGSLCGCFDFGSLICQFYADLCSCGFVVMSLP